MSKYYTLLHNKYIMYMLRHKNIEKNIEKKNLTEKRKLKI